MVVTEVFPKFTFSNEVREFNGVNSETLVRSILSEITLLACSIPLRFSKERNRRQMKKIGMILYPKDFKMLDDLKERLGII